MHKQAVRPRIGAQGPCGRGRGIGGGAALIQLAAQARRSAPVARLLRLQEPVIQRERTNNDVFDYIDAHREISSDFSAVQVKRLLYWYDTGDLDTLNARSVGTFMAKKIPGHEDSAEDTGLPDFMSVRDEFAVDLPSVLGNGTIRFRKKTSSNVFEGRGWISDNVYWRPDTDGRIRYMVHAILEWSSKIGARDEPKPHVTLRNADTQAKIDLDITNPRGRDAPKRSPGKMAVTRSSYSRGLNGKREPGGNMRDDQTVFANLEGDTVKSWLTALIQKAQDALKPDD